MVSRIRTSRHNGRQQWTYEDNINVIIHTFIPSFNKFVTERNEARSFMTKLANRGITLRRDQIKQLSNALQISYGDALYLVYLVENDRKGFFSLRPQPYYGRKGSV